MRMTSPDPYALPSTSSTPAALPTNLYSLQMTATRGAAAGSPPPAPALPTSPAPGDHPGPPRSSCCTRRRNVETWADDTDTHGVKRFTRTRYHWTYRLVYGVLFTLAVTFLLFQLTKTVIKYFNYQHVTLVDIEFTKEIDFPAVTICNLNKYRRSKLTEDDLHDLGHYLELLDYNGTLLYPESYPQDWVDWVQQLNITVESENTTSNLHHVDFDEFTRRVGNTNNETLVHCLWGDHPCEDVHLTEVLTHHGLCTQFNGHNDDLDGLKVVKSGAGSGLKMYIDVDQEDYLHFEESDDLGIKIQVHWRDEPTFVKELGMGMRPGLHYFMEITEEQDIGVSLWVK